MEESLKRRQSSECSYQHDPYSWALEQARALRQRRAAELDWDNLAEEVEDLARRDAHALQSNCEVLIAHLLKLAHANDSMRRRNLRLWRLHARNARRRIADLLAENPGLKNRTGELFARAWPYGRDEALVTLRCDDTALPDACPWTFEQACDIQL
jgi:predicted ATP-dependent Lon-type protease